jgi:hypothetical protein
MTVTFLPVEQNLRHHSLVLVIQAMAMKYRHPFNVPFNDGVGEIQNDLQRSCPTPLLCPATRDARAAHHFLRGREVRLVYVEMMQFGASIGCGSL